MPYFTSTPVSACRSFEIFGVALRSLVRLETAYGLISRFLDPGGASSPTTAAASDAWQIPTPPSALGIRVRDDHSCFHRVTRRALKPQIWARPGRYRRDLNGMAASIVQPP